MDQPDAIWAFVVIVAFIAGVITAAWCEAADRDALIAERDQARADAQDAIWKAATAAERAEHARAAVERNRGKW